MFFISKMRIAAGATIHHSARVSSLKRRTAENRFYFRRFERYLSDDVAGNVEPKEFDFSSGYTQEEQDAIKTTLNTSSLDKLKSYDITEARIKKLIAYREKKLGFKSLNEILLFPGIDIAVLDKFCKSIVRKPQSTKKLPDASVKGDFLTPPLDEDARATINTCTGIWVNGKIVSWAQLDANCNLLQWDCESLGEINMKDGLVAIVDSVARIISRVGPSDVYVMEAEPVVPFSRVNSSSYYATLQRQQITASIASLLGTRHHRVERERGESVSRIVNFHTMRFRTTARLFNLLIGSENVSAESVVGKLIRVRQDEELKDNDKMEMFAHVVPDLQMHYESRDSYQREQMNWALLLIVSFVNLSILRSNAIHQTMAKSVRRNKS